MINYSDAKLMINYRDAKLMINLTWSDTIEMSV